MTTPTTPEGPTLGVITPLSGRPFDPLEDRMLAQVLDGGLADAVWVRDLPCVPGDDPDRGQGDDPFAQLARLAAAYPSLDVSGTASVILGTRHPLVTARAAVGAQVHARGGFVLGLGSAGKPGLAAALAPRPPTVAAVRQEWQQIRTALHGGAPAGAAFDVPPGFTPPPMWLASSDLDKWRAVGPMADGWLTFLTTPADFCTTLEQVEDARGRHSPPLSVGVRLDVEVVRGDRSAGDMQDPVRGVVRCTPGQLADLLAQWLPLPVDHYLIRLGGDLPLQALRIVRDVLRPAML